MSAVPLHCDGCGKEWWWEFRPGGPDVELGEPGWPSCSCDGRFSLEAPAHCPQCRSADLEQDPNGASILYD